ncbi:hypothetical protein [Micromonospora craniellae]|uniref:hypothetical protein n=1 Tax=Micromonospora craniellae TaxID=2294034 RepID=UPI0018F1CA02|nr:hypothetical protein [Micromonospora craniellae]
MERVLFALVAGRALAPSSKLAAAHWVCHDVAVPGLDTLTDDACYRAMDELVGVEPALTRAVYDHIADLLNLEVDLLFFDTTSTYFELDEVDELLWRDALGKAVAEDDPTAVKQQRPPRRPAPGRGRYGRHPHRHPRAGVVLAGQHG